MTPTLACPVCGVEAPPAARFCPGCGVRLTTSDAGRPLGIGLPVGPRLADLPGERRLLTVAFCDLVGSTELSTRIDPEDFREVIGSYQACVTRAMTSYGGFIADYMGDGTLIYFGYPEAKEDDAERAVRGGLVVLRAVSALAPLPGVSKLQARVGIATGVVVVGNIIGVGGPRALSAAGETPNLAARLQRLAEPDTLVIDANTRRTVGDLFECQDLGQVPAKGVPRPVPIWRVMGPGAAAGRFEAQRAIGGLAPLMGREAELSRLLSVWREARAGNGQVALLIGEAGIGKSRLAAALLERLAGEPHVRVQYFCSPHQQDSPLYPFIQQLEHAAGFSREDSPERKRTKLGVALGPVPAEDFELVANLLTLPLPATGDRPPLDPLLTPRVRRERTMQALLAMFERTARRKPVLMVLEDAQWSDPTTLELLRLTVERGAGLPSLVLVTSRPEFRFDWGAEARWVARIALEPLARTDSASLVRFVAGFGRLSRTVVDDIVERTDGIPLFIEELTKALVEADEMEGPRRALLECVPRRRQALPAALHASLLARLDRLGPAKEAAQAAAVIGRDFTHELLGALLEWPDATLRLALERLAEAGLAFRRETAPADTYRFKHALVQDTAYDTLLRDRRRGLHARIARVLEQRYPETVSTQPQILAHHCTEGGLLQSAIDYWLQAGRHALARSAMVETIAHLRRGIDLLAQLPDDEWRAGRELALRIALGKAQIATQGYAVAGTGETFARALALCERLGRPPEMLSVSHGLWTHALMRAELASARRQAEAVLAFGESRRESVWSLMGRRFNGITCHPLGAFAEARDHLERGLRLYDPAQRSVYATLTVDDPRVVMLMYLSWSLLFSGEVDGSRRRRDESLREARELSHPYTLAHAFIGAALGELTVESPQAALRTLDELLPLVEEQGISYYSACATTFKGWCLDATGHAQEGLRLLREGVTAYRATGTVLYLPSLLRMSAEVHGRQGLIAEGLRQITEAAELLEATAARWDAAEIQRVRGELLLASGERGAAEAMFQSAHAAARAQGARIWELRAAMAVARLGCDAGRRAEAAALVEAACVKFRVGLDTPDLREARAMAAGMR